MILNQGNNDIYVGGAFTTADGVASSRGIFKVSNQTLINLPNIIDGIFFVLFQKFEKLNFDLSIWI